MLDVDRNERKSNLTIEQEGNDGIIIRIALSTPTHQQFSKSKTSTNRQNTNGFLRKQGRRNTHEKPNGNQAHKRPIEGGKKDRKEESSSSQQYRSCESKTLSACVSCASVCSSPVHRYFMCVACLLPFFFYRANLSTYKHVCNRIWQCTALGMPLTISAFRAYLSV